MNHLAFIIAAFSVGSVGISWLALTSYLAMRRAEARADALRGRD